MKLIHVPFQAIEALVDAFFQVVKTLVDALFQIVKTLGDMNQILFPRLFSISQPSIDAVMALFGKRVRVVENARPCASRTR